MGRRPRPVPRLALRRWRPPRHRRRFSRSSARWGTEAPWRRRVRSAPSRECTSRDVRATARAVAGARRTSCCLSRLERAVKVSRAGLDRTAQAQLAACVATRNRPCEPVRAAPSQRAGIRRRPTRRMLQRSPGSPAGGCGVCYGSPRNAGIAAHAIIEAAFRAAYGFQVLTELEFLAPSPGDDNGRLDLAVPTAEGFDIGEIKPANAAGLIGGDRDLLWYEIQLQRLFNMRVGRMRLP